MTTSNLPPHVYLVKDRHGKLRYRFVRKGWKSSYIKGDPRSAEFHRAYADILAKPLPAKAVASPSGVVPKSLDDLFVKVKQGTKWNDKKPRTQHVQSLVVERFLNKRDAKGRRYGERPVSRVTVVWLERVFADMAATPAQANVLRKILAGFMKHAVKLQWRPDNPVAFTDALKEAKVGYHDWTDAEIEQYRATHKLGTMARLTIELALNTAARRCNVAKMTRDDIVDGRIITDHAKNNNESSVPMLATTKAALDALPVTPIKHLVVTIHGKPFSDAGLGNRMRKWCDEAGLPQCSMHGLRKAMSRILAEHGATDAEGQAVTGHKKASTFQYYRAKANRVVLADRAFSNLPQPETFQPDEKGEK